MNKQEKSQGKKPNEIEIIYLISYFKNGYKNAPQPSEQNRVT